MSKIWIPIDVKIQWFSFLEAPDLVRASRVCRSWSSLVQKTAEATISNAIGAACPPLTRGGKLQLLHRLNNATQKENMGYLLAWAAGSRGACRAPPSPPRHAARRPFAAEEQQLVEKGRVLWRGVGVEGVGGGGCVRGFVFL